MGAAAWPASATQTPLTATVAARPAARGAQVAWVAEWRASRQQRLRAARSPAIAPATAVPAGRRTARTDAWARTRRAAATAAAWRVGRAAQADAAAAYTRRAAAARSPT